LLRDAYHDTPRRACGKFEGEPSARTNGLDDRGKNNLFYVWRNAVKVFQVMWKLNLFVTNAFFFGATLMGNAQQAADVDLATKSAQKNTNAESAGARPENVPELSQLDEMFKQTSMGKAADAQRLRVEWRQLKNKVVNDPDLIATKHAADRARTDLEKREKLRAYYKLYFARVRQFPMSPEMKQYVDAMEASQLGLTAQSRVRPSPTASPAATN
jgi:hypothetical protein